MMHARECSSSGVSTWPIRAKSKDLSERSEVGSAQKLPLHCLGQPKSSARGGSSSQSIMAPTLPSVTIGLARGNALTYDCGDPQEKEKFRLHHAA